MAYYEVNGTWYEHPTTKTDYDCFYTDVGGLCETCGTANPYRHIVNDRCKRCLHESATSLINAHMGDPSIVVKRKVCAKGGHILITRPGKSKCLVCAETPTPRQAAMDAGEKWYNSGQICPDCQQPILKYVVNGRSKCGCKPNTSPLSPRQQAIADGLKWYDSGEVCPDCGFPILIYVPNGRTKCGCSS